MKRPALKSKMRTRISRSKREVFLHSDFEKLAGYNQVGRALRQLITEGVLMKVGYGLYAKARLNRITGKPMLSAPGGFTQVAQEALSRLGVQWEHSEAMKAYQSGSTTQVPVNAEVVIRNRFRRKIGTDKFVLRVARA